MAGDVPSPWNRANAVTVARIALVPVFAWALLVEGGQSVGWRLVATAIFAVAAATDRVDGWLARRFGLVTDVGKLIDPIADKLLIGTALILLAWPLGELPWWVPALILLRELGITVMRLWIVRYVVLPASRGGKLKTVLQSIAIGLFLLPVAHLPGWITVVAWAVLWVAIIVTLVTGVDYLHRGLALRREAVRSGA